MDKKEIKDKLLYGSITNINPIKPLLIWGDTNLELVCRVQFIAPKQ